MDSACEQHRFAKVNTMLTTIAPRFGTILELGCGEGHQSVYLRTLAERLYGIDLSAKAIDRARKRCPDARFATSSIGKVDQIFPGIQFDLITACEVLYYLKDPEAVLRALQERSSRIFISSYIQRSKDMHSIFAEKGYRSLGNIVHGQTIWQCFLWERPEPEKVDWQ